MNDSSQMPTSPATEQRVIGYLVARGSEALSVVIENRISHSDFADPFFGEAFSASLQRHASRLPFGSNELIETLKPRPSDRTQLFEAEKLGFETLALLPALCAELRSLTNRRKTISLSALLDEAARENPDAVPNVIADLLQTQASAAAVRSWRKVCEDATTRANDTIAGRVHEDDFLSWGWSQLDRTFKRMRRGELIVIAARPSVGKSSLVRQIASAAAIKARAVLLESLEVSADDVIDGMATALSGHNAGELGRLLPEDQKRFLQSIDTLRAAPLMVCEDRSLAGIIARATAAHAQRPLTVLAIDYLGLISDCEPARGETKAQAVGSVTKALKRLAMELRIAVILLAQLNRQSANDGNREPRLSDLRDSGDIEQDADRVIFIHRPDECPITKHKQDAMHDVNDLPRYGCALIQAKGRAVGTGFGAVWFNRRLARFEF